MRRLISRATLIALIVAGLACPSYGADNEQVDVILGKNGSIVKGKIIGRVEGKYITVQMAGGKQITIRFSQIAEIRKGDEDYEARHRQILDSLKLNDKETRSYLKTVAHADLSYGADDTSSAVSLTGAVALLTRSGVTVGFGGGWDKHENNRFFPVFGELGYYLAEGEWKPYLRLQMGYSLGWRGDNDKADFGGFRLQFGMGLQKAVSERLSLTAQFNYSKQSSGAQIYGRIPGYEWISGSLGGAF